MEEHTLVIDSRFAESNPKSNVDFYVTFNPATATHTGGYPTQVFKNVEKVELCSMSLAPTYANETGEHYMVLDVEELNNRIHANSPHANAQFAMIYTEKGNEEYVKMVKGHDFNEKIKRFDPPLSALSRLTIKLRHAGTGEVIPDYGSYYTFVFKITCRKSLA